MYFILLYISLINNNAVVLSFVWSSLNNRYKYINNEKYIPITSKQECHGQFTVYNQYLYFISDSW